MRLRIERQGGYVGKRAVGECDTKNLSPDQQKALDELLKSPPQPTPSPGADRFRYKVEVTDDSGKREIDVPEDAMPDELASIPQIEP
jgi:hypothetical protein